MLIELLDPLEGMGMNVSHVDSATVTAGALPVLDVEIIAPQLVRHAHVCLGTIGGFSALLVYV